MVANLLKQLCSEEEMHLAKQNGNRYDPCEYFIEEQII